MKKGTFYTFVVMLVSASVLLSSCTMATPEPTATSTPVPPTSTPTLEPTSTITPTATITLTPTATLNVTATKQTEDFAALVENYHEAGYVSSTTGTYNFLGTNVSKWAQLNYYIWEEMDYSPTNFIIKSDISWRSASPAANSSGCGYVFRLQDDEDSDHYMFYISLKGYVELATNVGNWKSLGKGFYGNPAQNGGASVVLIVEDNVFRVLVNDKLIKTYSGFAGKLTTGDLAYTVLSGINKSYGTECKFKDTELWTITKP